MYSDLRYTYTAAGNVETVSEGSTQKVKYYYDIYDRLVREDNAYDNKTYVYAYDDGGNITSKKICNYGSTSPTQTIYYVYGDSEWKDLLTSYNGQSIVYDGAGNPLTYRDGMSMTWANGRQLASVNGLSMSYDYAGYRVKKGDTKYFLDGSRIMGERRGDGTVIWYYYDESGVCGMNLSGTDYYFQKDLFGNVAAIYNKSGTLQCTYNYDAWGNHTVTSYSGSTIGNVNPFRYRGYYYDTETGFYYLNSRYYDPATGRFINAEDPTLTPLLSLFHVNGVNLFAYCFNNPVCYVDDSGFVPTPFEFKGWNIRFDPANTNTYTQRHVHVTNGKKHYSQNDDGSPHDDGNNSPGGPPSSVKKELKKNGWDWDGKKNDPKPVIIPVPQPRYYSIPEWQSLQLSDAVNWFNGLTTAEQVIVIIFVGVIIVALIYFTGGGILVFV